MGDDRFGPNTAEVETFLDRLRHLPAADWDKVMEASPGVGALPELEVKDAPEYFRALQEATRIAKSNVFPDSESAFYDAMRTAQLIASATIVRRSSSLEPAAASLAEIASLAPDSEAEALDRTMATAYEEESLRRMVNACMVAAGAVVVVAWLPSHVRHQLLAPFSESPTGP